MKNKVIVRIALILLVTTFVMAILGETTLVQAKPEMPPFHEAAFTEVSEPSGSGGGTKSGSGGTSGSGSGGATAGGANFDFSGFEGKTADDSIKTPVEDALGAAINVIRIIGTGISIIILTSIGIKYMIASPGDRADFKKGAVQYVVGAVVLFGAVNIMNILVDVIPRIIPE